MCQRCGEVVEGLDVVPPRRHARDLLRRRLRRVRRVQDLPQGRHLRQCRRVPGQEARALEDLHAKLSRTVEQVLGIRARITLVEPHTIKRSEGKAKRLIDKREM